MINRPALLCLAVLAVSAASVGFDRENAWAQPPERSQRAADSQTAQEVEPGRSLEPDDPAVARRQYVERVLEQSVEAKFSGQPLREVAAILARDHHIPVVIDNRALQTVRLSPDVPITIKYRNIQLRSALRHMLSEIGLTFIVRNDELTITTPELAESATFVRVYHADEILRSAETDRFGSNRLTQLISETVEPDTWNAVGGIGSVTSFRGSVVINAIDTVHNQAARLMHALREVQQQYDKDPSKVDQRVIKLEPSGDRAVQQKLRKQVSLSFREQPLSAVADYLSSSLNLTVLIDRAALEPVGLGPDVPVTIDETAVSAADALRRLLRPLGLTTSIHDEALIITTPEVSANRLTMRLYPVYDLLSEDLDAEMRRYYLDQLQHTIRTTVTPGSWDHVGGPATTFTWEPAATFGILQTDSEHEEVERLLGELRAAVDRQRENAEATGLPMALQVYHLAMQASAEEVQQLVQKAVAPAAWQQDGALLEAVSGALVVRHNHRIHRQVQQLLRKLAPPSAGGDRREGGMF